MDGAISLTVALLAALSAFTMSTCTASTPKFKVTAVTLVQHNGSYDSSACLLYMLTSSG
jgi:hypothetical protein